MHLGNAGRVFAKATMVSFWSLDAMKATLSREVLDAKDLMGELLVPRSGDFAFDLGMVAVLGSVFLFVAWLGLRLKDRRG